MRNKLYVTNLDSEPSPAALRTAFGRAGEVSDVAIVPNGDRGTKPAAFVTMSTEAEARRAVADLDGMTFGGQALRVSIAYDRSDRDGDRDVKEKRAEADRRARITQQFRERENMTYELDCAGTPLIVRVFFRVEDSVAREWRIDVRTSSAPDAVAVAGAATSRLEALRAVAHQCVEARGFGTIDWTAVEQAMLSVHAV